MILVVLAIPTTRKDHIFKGNRDNRNRHGKKFNEALGMIIHKANKTNTQITKLVDSFF
jgi:hypothetical protein